MFHYMIEMEHTPKRATLLADYSSLLAALSDAKLTKVRDALPPARDLFGRRRLPPDGAELRRAAAELRQLDGQQPL